MFFLVKLLEESGYAGPRHFDCHPYRTESEDGVWDFARGCMRTYLILKEKARRFAEDREIQGLLEDIGATDRRDPHGLAKYGREGAARLGQASFDPVALGRRGLGYERLDQLVVDLLLGVR
jgi:xylose isomerase